MEVKMAHHNLKSRYFADIAKKKFKIPTLETKFVLP